MNSKQIVEWFVQTTRYTHDSDVVTKLESMLDELISDRLEPKVELTADEQYTLDIAVQLLTSCKDGEVMIERDISPDTIDSVANMIEEIGNDSSYTE